LPLFSNGWVRARPPHPGSQLILTWNHSRGVVRKWCNRTGKRGPCKPSPRDSR